MIFVIFILSEILYSDNETDFLWDSLNQWHWKDGAKVGNLGAKDWDTISPQTPHASPLPQGCRERHVVLIEQKIRMDAVLHLPYRDEY